MCQVLAEPEPAMRETTRERKRKQVKEQREVDILFIKMLNRSLWEDVISLSLTYAHSLETLPAVCLIERSKGTEVL